MYHGGVQRQEDLGRRKLVSSRSMKGAAWPIVAALVSSAKLPAVVGLPLAALLLLRGVLLLVQANRPTIVTLDAEGFTIDAVPWRRPQVALWAECSGFVVHDSGDSTTSGSRRTRPATVRYFDAAFARRHPLRSRIVASMYEGANRVLPPDLDRLSAYQVASLFFSYRQAYGRTASR